MMSAWWSSTKEAPEDKDKPSSVAMNPLRRIEVRWRNAEDNLEQCVQQLNLVLVELKSQEPMSPIGNKSDTFKLEETAEPEMRVLVGARESKQSPEAENKKEAEWLKDRSQWAFKLDSILERFLAVDKKHLGFHHEVMRRCSNDIVGLIEAAKILIFDIQSLLNDGIRFILACREKETEKLLVQANNVSPGEMLERGIYNQTKERWRSVENELEKFFRDFDKVKSKVREALEEFIEKQTERLTCETGNNVTDTPDNKESAQVPRGDAAKEVATRDKRKDLESPKLLSGSTSPMWKAGMARGPQLRPKSDGASAQHQQDPLTPVL